MIKAKIVKASNLHVEFKTFSNYEELFNWMKETHTRFIIEFTEDFVEITIYDDYVE